MDTPLDALRDGLAHALGPAAPVPPRVWVHRNFHSRNLMVTTGNYLGILDFQDA